MVDEARAGRSLVDLARDGDAAAFESLVRTRMDAMYRLGLAILGDEADAADAAQMTFVAAWRHLPRLRDIGGYPAAPGHDRADRPHEPDRNRSCRGPGERDLDRFY
jgi:hypothetical protein